MDNIENRLERLSNLNKPTDAELISFNNAQAQISHHQATILANQDRNPETQYVQQSLFQMIEPAPAPKTLTELIKNTQKIAGKSVAEVASKHHVPLIPDLNQNKGWLGNLIEIALGAVAGSKPTQDFVNLGIELKTLAINSKGKVANDIFVSALPLQTYMLQE